MPQNATYTGDLLTSKTALIPVSLHHFLYSVMRDILNFRYMLLVDFVFITRCIIRYCCLMTRMPSRLLSRVLSNYHGILLGSPGDFRVKLHFLPGNVFPASCISPCREMSGQVFSFPLLPTRFRFPLMPSHLFLKTTSLWSCHNQELITCISFFIPLLKISLPCWFFLIRYYTDPKHQRIWTQLLSGIQNAVWQNSVGHPFS